MAVMSKFSPDNGLNVYDIRDRIGEQEQIDLLKDTVGWTGKNRLKNILTSKTVGNYTATVDDNKVITINGNSDSSFRDFLLTPSSASERYLLSDFPLDNKILSGCTGGSSNTYFIAIAFYGSSDATPIGVVKNYDGDTPINIPTGAIKWRSYITIGNTNASNLNFYPMIRDASIADPTYEPYHESVDTCKADNSTLAPVEPSTSASKLITAGEHFMNDGDFCTAKMDISASTPFSSTNTKRGTVADELKNLEDADTAITADITDTQNDVEFIERNMFAENVDSEAYFMRKGKGELVDFDIIGGSIVMNQMILNGNFENANYWTSYRCTLSVANNIMTVTSTDNDFGNAYSRNKQQGGIPAKVGHKYFVSGQIKSDGTHDGKLGFRIGGTVINSPSTKSTKWSTFESIGSATASEIQVLTIEIFAYGNGAVSYGRKCMIMDLTQMLGAEIADYIYSLEQANSGAGVSWFRRYFQKQYYTYDVGSIASIVLSKRRAIGKNSYTGSPSFDSYNNAGYWDIQSETLNGYPVYKSNTAWYGAFTRVWLPVGEYVFSLWAKNESASTTYVYITNDSIENSAEVDITIHSKTLTDQWQRIAAPFKVIKPGYVIPRLECDSDNKGICVSQYQIEFGKDPTEYEPYVVYEYPLDRTKICRGIPKLVNNQLSYDGDIYKADGTYYKRCKAVDLSSLNWQGKDNSNRFYADISDIIVFYSYYDKGFISSHLPIDAKVISDSSNAPNLSIAKYTQSGYKRFYIKDETHADVAELKSYLTGKYVIYQLNTPTIESAEPFELPQKSFYNGLEELVDAVENRNVPIGVQAKYYISSRDSYDDLEERKLNKNNGCINSIAELEALIPNVNDTCVVNGGNTLTSALTNNKFSASLKLTAVRFQSNRIDWYGLIGVNILVGGRIEYSNNAWISAGIISTDQKSDISALGPREIFNASKLYHPGEHFYKDGAFCTVTGGSDVAVNTPWAEGTNYSAGDVASYIPAFVYKLVEINAPSDTTEVINDIRTPLGLTNNPAWFAILYAEQYNSGNTLWYQMPNDRNESAYVYKASGDNSNAYRVKIDNTTYTKVRMLVAYII